jgi:CopG family nickel-responsive transcriptional regulator
MFFLIIIKWRNIFSILKNMPVVSISLSKKLLEELENVQEEFGYSGRSETIRAAIRMLVNDARVQDTHRGHIQGVLIVIHDHTGENKVSEVKHGYLDVIYTQLHNRFREGKCLELFIIDGNSERVINLVNALRRIDENEYVKLFVI